MSFYVTGGSLQYNAPSYIERQADLELFQGLLEGDFCYVLTARQMGKSSLMVRTANRLRETAIRVAALDLTAIGGQNVLPDQWYRGLLDALGQALDLEEELEVFWRESAQLGPLHRFMKALRQVILPRFDNPSDEPPGLAESVHQPAADLKRSSVRLVIFVDEIDFVRSLPFPTDEFFAAIRQCYNHRTLDHAYHRVTFCLLGVAAPTDLIRDTRTTPFNIGRRIELNDFTYAEAATLAAGLQVDRSAEAARRATELLARIFYWTDGHPYLTQKLCRVTAEALQGTGEMAGCDSNPRALVDGLCDRLFFSPRARERDDNLIFVRERLLREQSDRATLLDLYRKIWSGKRVMDDEFDPLITLFRLAGIVRVRNGQLQERNRIYARVFDSGWIRANMPNAELRRQRAAFRRGVAITSAISLGVLALMAWLIILAVEKSNAARIASARSNYSQARAERVSGRAGRRTTSLAALKQAAQNYPRNEFRNLRDEAIACLALTDLVPTSQFPVSTGGICFARSDHFDLCATAAPEGTVWVHDRHSSSAPVSLSGQGTAIRQMRFSPGDRWLAVEYRSKATNYVTVWDWKAGRPVFSASHEVSNQAFDFTAGGEQLVIGRTNGVLMVYSLPEGPVTTITRYAPQDPRKPLLLRCNPKAPQVALIRTDDQSTWLFDLRKPTEFSNLYHGDLIRDLAWHPRGDLLATACDDGLVYLWAVEATGTPERTLSGHEGRVLSVTFSHHGDLIASSGTDRTVRMWTTLTQNPFTLVHTNSPFNRLRFNADDRYLEGTGEQDQMWEVLGGEYRALEWRKGPDEEIKSIDFSSDNRLLVVLTNDRLLLWDALDGTLQAEATLESPGNWATFLTSNDDILASLNSGLFHRALRANPGFKTLEQMPRGPAGLKGLRGFGQIALSLKMGRVAVAQESTIRVFDLEQTADLVTLANASTRFERLALSEDGRWLAALSAVDIALDNAPNARHDERPLRLWNIETRKELTLRDTIRCSRSFAFSPNSKSLLTYARGEYSFYAVEDWRKVRNLTVHSRNENEAVGLVAFARNCSLLAIADSNYSIRLLRFGDDAKTDLEQIAQLEAPDRRQLSSLALSPDGRLLAAATQSGLIQIWNLAAVAQRLHELHLGTL